MRLPCPTRGEAKIPPRLPRRRTRAATARRLRSSQSDPSLRWCPPRHALAQQAADKGIDERAALVALAAADDDLRHQLGLAQGELIDDVHHGVVLGADRL